MENTPTKMHWSAPLKSATNSLNIRKLITAALEWIPAMFCGIVTAGATFLYIRQSIVLTILLGLVGTYAAERFIRFLGSRMGG